MDYDISKYALVVDQVCEDLTVYRKINETFCVYIVIK